MAMEFLRHDLTTLNAVCLELTNNANQFIALESSVANWCNAFGDFESSFNGQKGLLRVESTAPAPIIHTKTTSSATNKIADEPSNSSIENHDPEPERNEPVQKPPKAKRSYLTLFRKVEDRLPAKYKLHPEHKDRLELVFSSIFDLKDTGATLSELVQFCGTSVVQCNEYLNTLVRLKLITRAKENKSIRYTVVRDNTRRPKRRIQRNAVSKVGHENSLTMMR